MKWKMISVSFSAVWFSSCKFVWIKRKRVKMLEPECVTGRAELTECDDVWRGAYVRAPTAERLAFIVLLELWQRTAPGHGSPWTGKVNSNWVTADLGRRSRATRNPNWSSHLLLPPPPKIDQHRQAETRLMPRKNFTRIFVARVLSVSSRPPGSHQEPSNRTGPTKGTV